MRGTTPRRAQGMADPVLALMVHAMGLETAPHYSAATPKIKDYRRRWVDLAESRDGPVNSQRVRVKDRKCLRVSKPRPWIWEPRWWVSGGFSLR